MTVESFWNCSRVASTIFNRLFFFIIYCPLLYRRISLNFAWNRFFEIDNLSFLSNLDFNTTLSFSYHYPYQLPHKRCIMFFFFFLSLVKFKLGILFTKQCVPESKVIHNVTSRFIIPIQYISRKSK